MASRVRLGFSVFLPLRRLARRQEIPDVGDFRCRIAISSLLGGAHRGADQRDHGIVAGTVGHMAVPPIDPVLPGFAGSDEAGAILFREQRDK